MNEYISVQGEGEMNKCEYYDRMGCCAPEKVSTEYCSTCNHTFGDKLAEKGDEMIQRYAIEGIENEYELGDHVRYADHLAEISRLRQLVAEDEARLNAAEKEIDYLQARLTKLPTPDEHRLLLHRVRNLLALIHNDGGQYWSEHGAEKAFEEASNIIYLLKKEA